MTEAIVMTVESVRTRATTNEALVTFAVPLEQAALVARFMSMIGKQVGAAFADIDAKPVERFGEKAAKLKLSGFFRRPEVWRAIGTDADYLDWLADQKCCADVSGGTRCAGDVIAAHVRRIANGAGAGLKPPYSAIPLCDLHHRKQHQGGETSIADKDWFDRQRIEHVAQWGWEMLRTFFRQESMANVNPIAVRDWAAQHGVDKYLPEGY